MMMNELSEFKKRGSGSMGKKVFTVISWNVMCALRKGVILNKYFRHIINYPLIVEYPEARFLINLINYLMFN